MRLKKRKSDRPYSFAVRPSQNEHSLYRLKRKFLPEVYHNNADSKTTDRVDELLAQFDYNIEEISYEQFRSTLNSQDRREEDDLSACA